MRVTLKPIKSRKVPQELMDTRLEINIQQSFTKLLKPDKLDNAVNLTLKHLKENVLINK